MKKYYVPDLKTRIVLLYLGGKTVSELATPKSKKALQRNTFTKQKTFDRTQMVHNRKSFQLKSPRKLSRFRSQVSTPASIATS